MKNNKLKKIAILSASFALSASLFNFGPVSFKVLPQDSVAYAAATDDLKTTINNVLNTINNDSAVLQPAYNAARLEIVNTIDTLNISTSLPNLYATNVSPAKAAALKAFLSEVIDYTQSSNQVFNNNVITELNEQFGLSVTVADTATLLLNTQNNIINDFSSTNLADFDIDLLSSLVIDSLKAELSSQWDNPSNSNSLVVGLKSIYGSTNKQHLVDDLNTLKTQIATNANHSVLKKGSAALAIGYAKYYIANNVAAIEIETIGSTKSIKKVSVAGITIPLSLLTWSDSSNHTTYYADTNRVVFDYSSFSTSGSANIKGTLGNLFSTYGFTGVVLVDTTVNYTVSGSPTGTGNVVTQDPSAIVSLANVNRNVVSTSQALIDLAALTATNNSGLNELAAEINQLVNVTAKLQLPAGTKVEPGKTVNLTVSEESFTEAFLNNFANLIADVVESVEGKVNVKPNITLDITELSDVSVTLPASLINKLVKVGVVTVTLKTADGEIVVPISATTNKLEISLASKAVEADTIYVNTNNQSASLRNVGLANYSIFASNIAPVQFITTILQNPNDSVASMRENSNTPVVASATSSVINKSKLTVAKVTDGNKLTLLASKYNEKTKKIEATISEPGTYTVVEVDADFADNNLAWAAEAIKNGARQGIFNGRGNNEFKPKAQVTQAEYLTILLRTFNLTATKDAGKDIKFTDVNQSNWYYDSVAAGLQYGIISQSTEKFEPNKILTREEMANLTANLLINTFGFKTDYNTTNTFTVDGHLIDEKYLSSVNFVTNEGIFNGRAAGKFDPQGTVTRAEAAVVALRLQNIR